MTKRGMLARKLYRIGRRLGTIKTRAQARKSARNSAVKFFNISTFQCYPNRLAELEAKWRKADKTRGE